jgi:hypothetical protein
VQRAQGAAVGSRVQNGPLRVFPFLQTLYKEGNFMPGSTWKVDPKADSAAPDVLAAYDAAVRKGKPSVECYRAAVEVWVRAHPDQVRTYAARQALLTRGSKT